MLSGAHSGLRVKDELGGGQPGPQAFKRQWGEETSQTKFFPPMSFINECKIQSEQDGMHRGRQESKLQEQESEGLITSEVGEVVPGSGTRGQAPAPLGTTDHGRVGMVCWPHGGNSLKTFHIASPVPVPPLRTELWGSLVIGSLGVSTGHHPSFQGAGPTCPHPKNKGALC